MPKLKEILNEIVDNTIRKRGYSYFLEDRVKKFQLNNNIATAVVKGSRNYNVKIIFDEKRFPIKSFCTCPYFEIGTCKHIVAVLYNTNKFSYFDQSRKVTYFKDVDVMNDHIFVDENEYIDYDEEDYDNDEALIELNSGADYPLTNSKNNLQDLTFPSTERKELRQKWLEEIKKKKEALKFSQFDNKLNGLIQTRNNSKIKKWYEHKIVFGINVSRYHTNLYCLVQLLKKDGSTSDIVLLNESNFKNLNYSSFHEKLVVDFLMHRNNSFDILSSEFGYRNIPSSQLLFEDILNFLKDREVYLYESYTKIGNLLHIIDEDGFAELKIDERNNDIELRLSIYIKNQKVEAGTPIIPIFADPLWVMAGNKIVKLKNLTFGQLNIFIQNNSVITIPQIYLQYFEDNYIPKIIKNLPINSSVYSVEKLISKPQKRIYIDEINSFNNNDPKISITLKFLYDEFEINYETNEIYYPIIKDKKIITIQRDVEAEEAARAELLSFRVKEADQGKFLPRGKVLDFLFNSIPQLKTLGFEIFGEDTLKNFRVNYATPKYNVVVTSGIDWFDVKVELDYGNTTLSLNTLLDALKFKKRYVQLDDGSVGILPEDWVTKFKRLTGFGDVVNSENSNEDKSIRFAKQQAKTIELLLDEAEQSNADEKYKEYLLKLNSFEKIETKKIPAQLNKVLRHYQKAGFNWFYFLKEYNFGGILADDMGLGKTLQVITLLSNEKKSKPENPSLIVAPTSVVFNWINEAEKFLPAKGKSNNSFKILNHTGSLRRKDDENMFGNYDIILTSYSILLRDSEYFSKQKFHYIIFDESQKIKNPISKSARAARSLIGKHKLCLTGTPVENNLEELWSQFSFINPGMLGSLNKFQEAFVKPIQKYNDNAAAEHLKKIIYPFVLRRTKDIVAKELPKKTEITHYCEMEPEQEKIYNLWRNSIREEIIKSISKVGIKKSGFKVIEGLLRLRQICNHPVLVKNNYAKKSGKFQEFIEQTEKVLDGGHKVLVFSQFVKMLEIISKYLDKNKIKYEYLTGSTKDREACVNNFQNNDAVKIFLISLKAGGFGLNLTAADYVFHYDPWWNPAVEMQATDRTHRIGQNKNVFVYKFITKNSVEEKILLLQEKKKKLVENIISSEKSILKNLSKDDIDVLFG